MTGISKLYCGADEPSSDALRYRRRPDGAMRRPVVVWNCTRRCNLKCRHCYSDSGAAYAPADELTTEEARRLIDDIAAFGCPAMLFSGGEPCLRPDLVELVARARERGVRVTLSTNGTLITAELARSLASVGISYIGVSFDGDEATHDAFRGVPGAYRRSLEGLRVAKEAGIKVGLRLTIGSGNWREIPSMFALMKREGIARACFYHLVYAGRGASIRGEDLSHADCRAAVRSIMDETKAWFAAGGRPEILTVDNHADGPFVCLELLREDPERAAKAMELLSFNGGNASGSGIGCVSWDGEVYADQFSRDRSYGNVRNTPFHEIWAGDALAPMREKKLHVKGRCAKCRWLGVCGGNLRARAEAATGDPWAPDPACYLTDEEIA